jgi:elongation factor 2 kinase
MCKYHEMGRFLLDPNDDFDSEAAFYHLQKAADLGICEAMSSLAKIYLQIPRDILPSYKVEVRFSKPMILPFQPTVF